MNGPRTSQTHPLQIAEVRTSLAHGRIGITFCPGKHDRFALSGSWARDLATDLDAVVAWGARLVLTLVEPAELQALQVPGLGETVRQRGLQWKHLPIADFSVPTAAFEQAWLTEGAEVRALLRSGADVLVHCKGGLGRAGMMAARLMVELGWGADEAARVVRRAREGAIETPAQLDVVRRTQALPVGTPAAGGAPLDTAALQRVGGQLGSNVGGVFEDGRGRRYYVKTLESPALARNERLAARLYQLAGAPTLRYVDPLAADQVVTAWAPLDKRQVAHLSALERRQAQQWLGVHAWTANWDAAGYHGDNQGVVDGTVLTLDVGGALAYRAQGDPKGRAFGTRVDELESLRHDRGNPHAARLFGDMSPEAVRRAVAVVTRLPAALVRAEILAHGGSAALAEQMVARQADLAQRVGA